MVPELSAEKWALIERATGLRLSSPDFSKLTYEQPLPGPDAFERARADRETQAPFKDPWHTAME